MTTITPAVEAGIARVLNTFIDQDMIHECIMTELQLKAGIGGELDQQSARETVSNYLTGKFRVIVIYEGNEVNER